MKIKNSVHGGTFRSIVITLTLGTMLLFSAMAWSLDLGQAKSSGLVGETPSGYLKSVGAPTGEVKSLVSRINAERKAAYQKIAKKNGTSLKNVEALAGKKAMDKSAAGEYILVGGNWKQK